MFESTSASEDPSEPDATASRISRSTCASRSMSASLGRWASDVAAGRGEESRTCLFPELCCDGGVTLNDWKASASQSRRARRNARPAGDLPKVLSSGEDTANVAAASASWKFGFHMPDAVAGARLPEGETELLLTHAPGSARSRTVALQEFPNPFPDFQNFHDFQVSGFVKV